MDRSRLRMVRAFLNSGRADSLSCRVTEDPFLRSERVQMPPHGDRNAAGGPYSSRYLMKATLRTRTSVRPLVSMIAQSRRRMP